MTGVYANAETYAKGIYKVLDRIDKRKGSHGLFADLGHKKTVNYIIKGVDKHGNDHWKRHGQQKRQYRPFFHKSIVHMISPVFIYLQQKSRTAQYSCVAKR